MGLPFSPWPESRWGQRTPARACSVASASACARAAWPWPTRPIPRISSAWTGGGLHVRFRLTERWGLELTSETVTGQTKDGNFSRTANPVTLAAAYHLTPNRPWDFYLLLGLGSTAETVQIRENEQVFEEAHVHLGVGLEHRFGAFGVGVELRAVGLSMKPEEGDAKRYRGQVKGPIPTESSGSQLNVVATYYL